MRLKSLKLPQLIILFLVLIIGLIYAYRPVMNYFDWGELRRYQKSNLKVIKMKNSALVVFMGDSITENWGYAKDSIFQNPNYINRGISGQNTAQMVLRFNQDVIALNPKTVVILGGTNDIAGTHGDYTNLQIQENIDKMCQMARAKNINIILAKILPAAHYNWKPKVKPVPRINEINAWIENYAKANNYPLIDYYSPMVDNQNGLKPEYAIDGVHPNENGYEIMKKVALEVLDE